MKRFQRKLIASGIIGNLLDGYDTCIFGYMAFYIASYFFVSPDTLNDLLKTLIIFTLSYLVRPIGGLVFGLIGDYVGRKKAFVSSLLLMGTSTTLIGILPGFNALGMLAIWLLLLLRILQSFGAGAEYTNSIVFLYEHAPEKQATFMTSFAAFGINLGFFCAAIIGSFVAALMQAHILGDWGWRLPFLIAIIGTFMGIWIRQSVPETIPFIMNNALKPRDFKQFFAQLCHDARQNHMNYLTLIAVIWLGTASTYLLYIYFPIHLSTIRHIPYSQSLIINTVSIALLVIYIPVFSYFSDRWERRKAILLATVGYLVLYYSNLNLRRCCG